MSSIFPVGYDLLMKNLEDGKFKEIRKQLLQKAEGRVLEIGSGTGVNFPLYENVELVDAIEPNVHMQRKSLRRQKLSVVPIHTHIAQAESLPFPDDTFDTVVCTLVFCTIPDPLLALNEMKRVSKEDATFLFFEHVRLNQSWLAKTQDALTPFWKKICDGCHLNRDTVSIIEQAGIPIKYVVRHYKGLFLTIECENKKIDGY